MDKGKYKKLKLMNVISGAAIIVFALFIAKGFIDYDNKAGGAWLPYFFYFFVLMVISAAIYLVTYLKIIWEKNAGLVKDKSINMLKILRAIILGVAIFFILFVLYLILGNILDSMW